MKICCVGAGYVGSISMAVVAKQCPDVKVTVVDRSTDRIDAWNSTDYDLPLYEPGLLDILKTCRGTNLFFSNDFESSIQEADVVFVAVNAPTKTSGIGAGRAQDLVHCEQTAREIARVATTGKIIVEQGSFPVHTAQAMARILRENGRDNAKHSVLSIPVFQSQGSAVKDLQEPSRILIGGDPSSPAIQTLVDLYATWVPREKILTTNLWSAELSKLVANALLAQRISSINTISALCEQTGADVQEISNAIGMDERIGKQYLKAGVGFGKSRFRKDISSLVYLCESLGLTECAAYWNSVIDINEFQKRRFSANIVRTMFNTVTHKKITILGYAFKKNTGDVRESPSMYILKDLLEEDACLHVYDPKVKRCDMLSELESTFGVHLDDDSTMVVTANDPYEACHQAHAVLVLTDWEEFQDYDYARIYENMEKPAFLFDGRNFLDHDALRQLGFEVHGVGKRDPNNIALQE